MGPTATILKGQQPVRERGVGRGRAGELALIAMIATVQGILVAPLFRGPFTQFRGSIEAAFITDARFIAERFPDLSWSPLWYLGFPFEWFYTPLLPAVVAVLGKLSGDIPQAYRTVSALGFVLGPVALYLAARELTRSRWVATIAATAFMFLPSLSYVFTPIRVDASAMSHAIVPPPWRLVALVEYGEGPHVLSLALALFAVAAALRYLREPHDRRLAIAVGLVVAVALTNLIGVLGAALYFFGIGASRSGGLAAGTRWSRLARVGLYAGVLSLGWYSLGFIRAVFGFSAPGGEGGGSFYAALLGVLLVVYVVGDLLARRGLPQGLDTVVLWLLTFGAVVVPQQLFQIALAPQPIRYLLELDAAFAIAVGIVVVWLGDRLLRRPRPFDRRRLAAAAGVVLLFLAIGLPGWRAVRPALEPDPGWETWSERRVALWLRDHLAAGERAYLSGSHAFWVNVFADVPQVRGGVDFAATNPWWAHVTYQVNTGADRDVSVLWLKALPVRYVVVTDATSSDAYQDFVDPRKFDGALPLVFEDRGVRIYEVPRVGDPVFALVDRRPGTHPPANAINRPPLESYVAEMAESLSPTSVSQTAIGSWYLEVESDRDRILVLRQAYDAGWRATVDGERVPVVADPLGQTAIAISAGRHTVVIQHGPHRDFLIGLMISCAAALWLVLRRLRSLRATFSWPAGRSADRAALVGLLGVQVWIGAQLGAFDGYPKGVDASQHLTRLRFVGDWFPHHNWLYAWSAGMPAFDNYPGLPYVASLPFTRTIGPEATLHGWALVAAVGLVAGIYGHLRERGRSVSTALVAGALVATSMAVWDWSVSGGVYARVVAMAFGAAAWWSHGRALRVGQEPWWAATSVLLAIAVASHPVVGAFAASYVALVHLSATGRRGLGRLFGVAGLSALLAAPALLSPLDVQVAGVLLGVDRLDLSAMPAHWLVDPARLGLAGVVLPLVVLLLALRARPKRAALAGAALLGVLGYTFAPNLRLPSAIYYIGGIDPFTTTYFVAITGALVVGATLETLGPRARRTILVVSAVLLVAQLRTGLEAFGPMVQDTEAPTATEARARSALVVDGGDLEHRFMPLTAYEAVWFNYRYRKPQLRDYYSAGQLHRDWIFWAYSAAYLPPVDETRLRVALDWFAVDAISVSADPLVETALRSSAALRPVTSTLATDFRQYDVVEPSPIVTLTQAPIVVVVGPSSSYDHVARLLFDAGAAPGARVPVWWPRTFAELPVQLRHAAQAIVVSGDRLGDPAQMRSVLDDLAPGTVVLWDVGDLRDGVLPAPWPVAGVQRRAIEAWSVTDRAGRIDGSRFSPARFGDTAWEASVPTSLSSGATAELTLSGAPIIASVRSGSLTLVVVGGNLFYHALDKQNAAERDYLLGFLGPPAIRATSPVVTPFIDPERRSIETDGSPVLVKESYYKKWTGRFIINGTATPLPIFYAGPGLMLLVPPGPGEVRLEYQSTGLLGWVGWAMFALGFMAMARPWRPEVRRRAGRYLAPLRSPKRSSDA